MWKFNIILFFYDKNHSMILSQFWLVQHSSIPLQRGILLSVIRAAVETIVIYTAVVISANDRMCLIHWIALYNNLHTHKYLTHIVVRINVRNSKCRKIHSIIFKTNICTERLNIAQKLYVKKSNFKTDCTAYDPNSDQHTSYTPKHRLVKQKLWQN